jgi:hypothetical protein
MRRRCCYQTQSSFPLASAVADVSYGSAQLQDRGNGNLRGPTNLLKQLSKKRALAEKYYPSLESTPASA